MKLKPLAAAFVLLLSSTIAMAQPPPLLNPHVFLKTDYDIVIEKKDGTPFLSFDAGDRGVGKTRQWLAAEHDKEYVVRISNLSYSRIGAVIAVDGRNIISGSPSNLSPSERMYVLEPGETTRIEGWRTGRNDVHRFFFTDNKKSYASRLGEDTGIGVIAAAIYREAGPENELIAYAAKGAPMKRAGTGFGDHVVSRSREVEFHPGELQKISLFRYEYRETLCQMGIATQVTCGTGRHEHIHLWDDDYYAPHPPR